MKSNPAAVSGTVARTLAGGAIAIMLLSSMAIAQKKVERKLPLGMEGALRVVNMVGSVTVHGWNKDTVLVRGTLGEASTFFMGGGYSELGQSWRHLLRRLLPRPMPATSVHPRPIHA